MFFQLDLTNNYVIREFIDKFGKIICYINCTGFDIYKHYVCNQWWLSKGDNMGK